MQSFQGTQQIPQSRIMFIRHFVSAVLLWIYYDAITYFFNAHPESFKTHTNDVWHKSVILHEMKFK